MRNALGRLAGIARAAAVTAIALTFASPAAAQFGGIRKKLKPAAEPAEPARAPVEPAPAAGPAGTIALTPDVVDRLLAGLKARDARRRAAEKEDTPYGRYHRELAAYQAAKPKCQAEQQTFANRMMADEKVMERYNGLINKMVEAQGRGDNRAAMAYNDSALAMQGPSCTLKEPQRPDGYYEAQREAENQAEQETMKVSGLSGNELAVVIERVEAFLRGGTPAGDLSPSEKTAVNTHASELKALLGIQDAAAAPAEIAEAPPPTPAQATPAEPAGGSDLGACMARNAQKHEKEIRALGDRAQAAQQAGNTQALMAIADTLQRLQMAGCDGAR